MKNLYNLLAEGTEFENFCGGNSTASTSRVSTWAPSPAWSPRSLSVTVSPRGLGSN